MKRIRLTSLATITIIGSALITCVHAQTTEPTEVGEVINTEFAQIGEDGLPVGWTFTKTPWIEVGKKSARGSGKAAAKPRAKPDAKSADNTTATSGGKTDGVTVSTLQDGSRTIVQLTYKDNQEGCLAQAVDVPPRAKEARFKVSVRGTPDVEGGKQTMPDCGFRFFNAEGIHLPVRKAADAPKQLSAKSWNDVEFSVDVPQGAKTCNVILGNLDRTNGTFEFRDLGVKFR